MRGASQGELLGSSSSGQVLCLSMSTQRACRSRENLERAAPCEMREGDEEATECSRNRGQIGAGLRSSSRPLTDGRLALQSSSN